jgi:hypothetical protein
MESVIPEAPAPAECKPPVLHIKYAGYHWLDLYDFDGRYVDTIIAQWNPVDMQWYHSGEIAKFGGSKPFLETKAVYNCYQPQPEPKAVKEGE